MAGEETSTVCEFDEDRGGGAGGEESSSELLVL